jgi:hypothetical protein
MKKALPNLITGRAFFESFFHFEMDRGTVQSSAVLIDGNGMIYMMDAQHDGFIMLDLFVYLLLQCPQTVGFKKLHFIFY